MLNDGRAHTFVNSSRRDFEAVTAPEAIAPQKRENKERHAVVKYV